MKETSLYDTITIQFFIQQSQYFACLTVWNDIRIMSLSFVICNSVIDGKTTETELSCVRDNDYVT